MSETPDSDASEADHPSNDDGKRSDNRSDKRSHPSAWIAGSDAPEKTEVRIGFIPLTDCAPIVMAATLGFDQRYGIKIVCSKEASWASVRDKLLNGELDAAHVLYGLLYGVQLGVAGPKRDMAALMTLNRNGQAITLSEQLRSQGALNGAALAQLMQRNPRTYTFAQTFPTGTHAMWLYYWLASLGIDPFADARVITVPPPQMVANMRAGNMDGCCVGEPWNAHAIVNQVGFTAVTTQQIWRDHPEKVLGATADFVATNPNTARAIVAAVLDASRWIDASVENRRRTAQTIAAAPYINIDSAVIIDRMLGHYIDGLGHSWEDPEANQFHDGGAVNFPYLSDGMWFLTQHKRWGLLKTHPDYLAVARAVNRIDIYAQAANAARVPLPDSPMRSSRLMDGVVWDGSDPQAYADGFSIHA